MQAALKRSQKTKREEEVKEININAAVTTVFKIRAGLDFLTKRGIKYATEVCSQWTTCFRSSPNRLYQVFSYTAARHGSPRTSRKPQAVATWQ